MLISLPPLINIILGSILLVSSTYLVYISLAKSKSITGGIFFVFTMITGLFMLISGYMDYFVSGYENIKKIVNLIGRYSLFVWLIFVAALTMLDSKARAEAYKKNRLYLKIIVACIILLLVHLSLFGR